MRKSPFQMGPKFVPFAMLLTFCMLILMLSPGISAWADGRGSGNDGHLAVSLMHDGEDGKVTDDDGIIGNSRRGADHAESHDRFARGAVDGPLMDSPASPDGEGGAINGNDGAGDGIGNSVIDDAARGINDASGDSGTGSMENGTADDGNSSGVLPWIIGIIVLLAVTLVILALIPKKSKSH